MSKKKTEEKRTIIPSQITPNGSLGLLAYGDLAFKAWRDVKKEINKKSNEKE